ncbi:MAG: rRNA large subunit methyltransferase I, partial [Clostridia bacterium]|nr:rRNA large subunit methyltransferase I [Clostridia bacterium]
MRDLPRATVTPKGEKFLRGGHVWVYADEITALEGSPENGAITDVYSAKGRYLGSGFYNDHSKIRIRIVTKNANDRFDEAFWERKLRWALEYRRTVMGETDFSCCRLIFGEADSFPGLTVDRFGKVLVTQVLSLGIEQRKEMIYRLLLRLLREEFGAEIEALFERPDVASRELEGMELSTAFWQGEGLKPDLDGKPEIVENGIRYGVDELNGQKTGFVLDQKYKRMAIRKVAKD